MRRPKIRLCSTAFLKIFLSQPLRPVQPEAYGPLRAANRSRSRDALDKLIASHAVSLGVILVTNNEADFRGYAKLTIENWVSQV